MKDNIAKITRWIFIAMIAILSIAGMLFYLNVLSVDFILNLGKLMVVLGFLVMLASPVYGFITNPANLKVLLISFVAGAVVLIISYFISSNELSDLYLEQNATTPEMSKIVGAGIIATYFMFIISIGAFIFSAIWKAIK